MTPEDIIPRLGPIVREKVIVQDLEIYLSHPSKADGLLDLPEVHDAFAKDEYMPYWAELWPASRMLAKFIAAQTWQPGAVALELGCGLGLCGIVAMFRGLKVVFSDYDACSLRFASDNAIQNGQTNFETRLIDWRNPPNDWKVPVIFAADLVYEARNVGPLVHCIKHLLAPDGVCYLTDQDRRPAQLLRETLDSEKFQVTTKVMRAGEPNGRKWKGTLYVIRGG